MPSTYTTVLGMVLAGGIAAAMVSLHTLKPHREDKVHFRRAAEFARQQAGPEAERHRLHERVMTKDHEQRRTQDGAVHRDQRQEDAEVLVEGHRVAFDDHLDELDERGDDDDEEDEAEEFEFERHEHIVVSEPVEHKPQ